MVNHESRRNTGDAEQEKRRAMESMLDDLAHIYDECSDNNERVEEIIRKVSRYRGTGLFDFNGIVNSLQNSISKFKDKASFISIAAEVLTPVLTARAERPEVFEKVRRDEALSMKENVKVSELMYYSRDPGSSTIRIHIAPGETIGVSDLLRAFRVGFKMIAQHVNVDLSITEISGTSWIVAEHPELMKRLGFTVTGPISDKLRESHFSGETREISSAYMKREEFLQKYL